LVWVSRVLGVSSTRGFTPRSLREKVGEMKRFGFWLAAPFLAALFASSTSMANRIPSSMQLMDDNVDVIVLVDESGSLKENDVAAEREAIIEMVSLPTILGRGIRIGIYPFSSGSDSPRVSNDCSLRPIDDGGDEYLRDCAKSIKRQQNGNTDFASTFRFVAEKFTDQEDDDVERSRTIILMTDGKYQLVTDRKPNSEEEQALLDSLEVLKESKIAIWSLGFGKADLQALQSYSDAASERDKRCDAAPSAYEADIANLGLQLRQVLAEVTCSVVSEPDNELPSKRFIHPLIDTVYVTVNSIDGMTPELYAPNGDLLCADDWQNAGSTFSCLVREDGTHSGKWELRATEGSQVIWEYRGTVQIQFDECPNPEAVSIQRFDGNSIDYSAAQLWPSVIVRTENTNTNSVLDDVKLEMNAQDVRIDLETSGNDTETFFELQSKNDSDGLPLLNSRPVSCENSEPPPTATTIAPATTVPPPKGPSCEELGNCPPPKWPYVVLLFVIAGGVFAAMRWLKSKQFPVGTVVKQESSVARGVWVDLPGGEIGGKRRMSLVVQSSGIVSVEPYGAGAQYVISPAGDQVKIVFSPDPESADESQNDIRVEPYGLPIRFSGFVLRVEKPEEEQEEID